MQGSMSIKIEEYNRLSVLVEVLLGAVEVLLGAVEVLLGVVNVLLGAVEVLLGAAEVLLGAVATFRKATISFVVSVCPSVRPHGAIRLPLDGFSLNFIFEYFIRKYT